MIATMASAILGGILLVLAGMCCLFLTIYGTLFCSMRSLYLRHETILFRFISNSLGIFSKQQRQQEETHSSVSKFRADALRSDEGADVDPLNHSVRRRLALRPALSRDSYPHLSDCSSSVLMHASPDVTEWPSDPRPPTFTNYSRSDVPRQQEMVIPPPSLSLSSTPVVNVISIHSSNPATPLEHSKIISPVTSSFVSNGWTVPLDTTTSECTPNTNSLYYPDELLDLVKTATSKDRKKPKASNDADIPPKPSSHHRPRRSKTSHSVIKSVSTHRHTHVDGTTRSCPPNATTTRTDMVEEDGPLIVRHTPNQRGGRVVLLENPGQSTTMTGDGTVTNNTPLESPTMDGLLSTIPSEQLPTPSSSSPFHLINPSFSSDRPLSNLPEEFPSQPPTGTLGTSIAASHRSSHSQETTKPSPNTPRPVGKSTVLRQKPAQVKRARSLHVQEPSLSRQSATAWLSGDKNLNELARRHRYPPSESPNNERSSLKEDSTDTRDSDSWWINHSSQSNDRSRNAVTTPTTTPVPSIQSKDLGLFSLTTTTPLSTTSLEPAVLAQLRQLASTRAGFSSSPLETRSSPLSVDSGLTYNSATGVKIPTKLSSSMSDGFSSRPISTTAYGAFQAGLFPLPPPELEDITFDEN